MKALLHFQSMLRIASLLSFGLCTFTSNPWAFASEKIDPKENLPPDKAQCMNTISRLRDVFRNSSHQRKLDGWIQKEIKSSQAVLSIVRGFNEFVLASISGSPFERRLHNYLQAAQTPYPELKKELEEWLAPIATEYKIFDCSASYGAYEKLDEQGYPRCYRPQIWHALTNRYFDPSVRRGLKVANPTENNPFTKFDSQELGITAFHTEEDFQNPHTFYLVEYHLNLRELLYKPSVTIDEVKLRYLGPKPLEEKQFLLEQLKSLNSSCRDFVEDSKPR